eukprot:TRINITY_DN49374_c0_g1_i1.p1 TRINITY_DN49374_c0_g1~~TRINITY_DN49374_c0_g1_i1.p1  ORF type:complete len:476 (+),score=52.77 TRINITY_DN49374_c0_g1_i1:28-1455(+)
MLPAAPGTTSLRGPEGTNHSVPYVLLDDRHRDSSLTTWSEGEALALAAPRRSRHWVMPAVLFLVALCIQNAGLYSATCRYIRQVDEVEGRAAGSELLLAALEDTALDDPLHRLLKPSRLAESLEGLSWPPSILVDLMSNVLTVSWLVWVIRYHDLQLWTRVLLTGTMLALLKGFLSWSTIVPDASGWTGCKERLGVDGLRYFREASRSGFLGFLQSLQDIFLLTMQSLWVLSRSTPHQLCADGVFSCSTSSCALVAVALYGAVQGAVTESRHERRATVLGLTGLLLLSVVIADMALAVGSKLHYSLDVFLALPLTLLLYGSPAVALASSSWAEVDEAIPLCNGALGVPLQHSHHRPPSIDSVGQDLPTGDLGVVSVAPCCIPFCFIGGSYFLHARQSPGTLHWSEEAASKHRQRIAHISAEIEQAFQRCEEVEAEVLAHQSRELIRAAPERAKERSDGGHPGSRTSPAPEPRVAS